MGVAASCGDAELDEAVLSETLLEIERGWSEEPFDLKDLES